MIMDRTTAYAKKVVRGDILKGKTEIACCKRHLDDMARKDFDYIFDVDMAEEAIDIANELVIAEGEEEVSLETRGFQDFIIGNLHGWRKKRTKKLRFREGYIQMARQNGKSFLSGVEANWRASFSGYKHGRVFCTATKQDQANIVWDEVKKFIKSDTDLSELYKIRDYEKTIISLVTGNVIKAIGRDTKSADGFRSILAIVDEYHAHPTNQMYKLMLDGQINVENALTLAITTAGFNYNSACHKQYEFAKQVLSGVVEKESLFVYIAEMDEDDDIWDYRNWAKANPLLLWNKDDTYDMEKVKDMSEKAIDAKTKEGEDLYNFLTKTLNQWNAYSGARAFDLDSLNLCKSEMDLGDMEGRDCYLGIDLSSGGDLTSIALVFPVEEKFFIHTHSFMPKLRLEEHERLDKAPYTIWAKKGLLSLTEGAFALKTDYSYIIAYIKDLIEKYKIKIIGVGYDPHNASAFIADLDFLGCSLTEIGQSARSLNDATVDLQLSVEARQIIYNENEALMTWSFANAKTTQNSFGEIKIMKSEETERIDVVDAVIDAWKLAMQAEYDVAYNAEDDIEDWLKILGGE